MRVLVTGHDGQVAQSLAERATDVEIVRTPRAVLDLANPLSIERAVAAIAPDVIVSAAAFTAVDRAETDPEAAFAVIAVGPGVLARAAASRDVPIIHLSTDYVFDGRLDRPYREADDVSPLGAYGRSKLAGEAAVATSGANYAILRTAWVYSPFGSNFVKTMLRLATERDELSVVDDQVGNPTSAFDIADAILSFIEVWRNRRALPRESIVHFAGSGQATWAEFAETVFAASRRRGGPHADVRKIGTADYPTPAARPANSRLNTELFVDTFGWQPPAWRDSLGLVLDRLVGVEQ